jgi:hypothetical protein
MPLNLLEPAPGKAPEALNGVDVARASGELISSIGVVIYVPTPLNLFLKEVTVCQWLTVQRDRKCSNTCLVIG